MFTVILPSISWSLDKSHLPLIRTDPFPFQVLSFIILLWITQKCTEQKKLNLFFSELSQILDSTVSNPIEVFFCYMYALCILNSFFSYIVLLFFSKASFGFYSFLILNLTKHFGWMTIKYMQMKQSLVIYSHLPITRTPADLNLLWFPLKVRVLRSQLYTDQALLSGHPWGYWKGLLNGGWPLHRGNE